MIDSKSMKKFISKALVVLEGDWVIIGGTVLSLMGIEERVTMDIDIVGINVKNASAQSIKLMELAEHLGLPVETINQSGEYFLSKIENYEESLIVFAESKKCRILRPNAYLFIKLKLARLSETDILDCLAFVRGNPDEALVFKKEIIKLIKARLKTAAPEREKNFVELLQALP